MTPKRPVHLNLFKIRLPLPGVASILHRASGAFLFLFIPFLLYGLQWSLSSEQEFEQLRGVLQTWPLKLLLVALCWGFLHHFFMGLRYLALDFDLGASLPQARFSAGLVLAASLAGTLGFGVWLW